MQMKEIFIFLVTNRVNSFTVNFIYLRNVSIKSRYCYFKLTLSPLDKPRCFWGKQLQICLNNKKKKKATNGNFETFVFHKGVNSVTADKSSPLVPTKCLNNQNEILYY